MYLLVMGPVMLIAAILYLGLLSPKLLDYASKSFLDSWEEDDLQGFAYACTCGILGILVPVGVAAIGMLFLVMGLSG